MIRALCACALVGLLASGAKAAPPPWWDWQTILYQSRTPAQLAALRKIGLTAGKVFANRDQPTQRDPEADALVRQHLRYYVENIATDFYAEYHRWRPDRTETADFLAAKRLHQQAPQDLAAFIRAPSLSDEPALQRVRNRLAATVRAYGADRPLYYSLADEAGIADLAAAWDFDFSPASLDGLRSWLHTQYPSLAALNQEWGSNFASWADIVPPTTDQAMQRDDDNFAAWADFKAWMDVAFARAVQAGTDAVHAADPDALAAIEGTQVPGWGGYDYSRLASTVDAMEIYDFGQNVDIARSLNPALVMVSTLSGHGDQQIHDLWRSLLMGMRGVILWDEADDLATPDGALASGGNSLAPALEALHGGVGALLINATPDPAPVAILYSQPSFRTAWMLTHRPSGPAWAARDAEAETQDTPLRAATRGFVRLLGHLGLQGRFISPAMLTDGTLARTGTRVLILPHTLALAPEEAAAIRSFAGSGGLVLADSVPGAFDSHSRRQPHPALADLFAPGNAGALFTLGEGAMPDAADGRDPAALARLATILAQHGVTPGLQLTLNGQPATDVTIYRYRYGTTALYALHRDTPGANITDVALARAQFVTIPRNARSLGRVDHLTVTLDPVMPTLLAISEAPLPGPALAAEGATLTVRQPGPLAVMHIDVTTSAGITDPQASGNLLVHDAATWDLTPNPGNPAAIRSVTATDQLSGQSATMRITAPAPK